MNKVFAFIILVVIFALGYFAGQKILSRIKPSVVSTTVVQNVGCDASCQAEIQKQVQNAIGSIPSSTPAKTMSPVPAPAATPSKMTQFISLDSAFSTTSTGWVDVPGTDVTFDINKDYSKNAIVSWQAALAVANSNGQAFARLFDETHGIAVSGSEISTTNNSNFVTAYSGNLNLWSGEINYRVQIKSLNSFNVSYAGGKIKIEY